LQVSKGFPATRSEFPTLFLKTPPPLLPLPNRQVQDFRCRPTFFFARPSAVPPHASPTTAISIPRHGKSLFTYGLSIDPASRADLWVLESASCTLSSTSFCLLLTRGPQVVLVALLGHSVQESCHSRAPLEGRPVQLLTFFLFVPEAHFFPPSSKQRRLPFYSFCSMCQVTRIPLRAISRFHRGDEFEDPPAHLQVFRIYIFACPILRFFQPAALPLEGMRAHFSPKLILFQFSHPYQPISLQYFLSLMTLFEDARPQMHLMVRPLSPTGAFLPRQGTMSPCSAVFFRDLFLTHFTVFFFIFTPQATPPPPPTPFQVAFFLLSQEFFLSCKIALLLCCHITPQAGLSFRFVFFRFINLPSQPTFFYFAPTRSAKVIDVTCPKWTCPKPVTLG